MKLTRALLAIAALLFVFSACVSQVDRTSAPTPTLFVTPEPTPTNTPNPTPTVAPTATATPVPDPTATPVPDPTATPTPTPVPDPTATPTPTPVVPGPLPERDNDVLPHVFVGSVTIGGLAVPDGTSVTVWIADYNRPVGSDTTSGGTYSVLAHQYGTGSFSGRTLIFKVNGQDTGEIGTWVTGEATILAISLD